MLVCPETAKIGLIDLSLAWLIGKLYGFASFEIIQEVFSGKIRPKNADQLQLGVWLTHYSGLRAALREIARSTGGVDLQ
jgi:hypothetical protein